MVENHATGDGDVDLAFRPGLRPGIGLIMRPETGVTSALLVVDDDEFSARLLMRRLTEAGAGSVQWLGDAQQSRQAVSELFSCPGMEPRMLIVDLKSSSTATLDFVKAVAPQAEAVDLPIVAMAQSDERTMRSALYEAGAAGVFVRYADRAAYRDEIRAILKFWCGFRRPGAVGM